MADVLIPYEVLNELNDSLKSKSRKFLGDPEAIRKAAEAVARQTEGKKA